MRIECISCVVIGESALVGLVCVVRACVWGVGCWQKGTRRSLYNHKSRALNQPVHFHMSVSMSSADCSTTEYSSTQYLT